MKKISSLLFVWLLVQCVACHRVEAPEPLFPVPTNEQVEWQKKEFYAFVHFGLNTFNDIEWGYGDTPASTFHPLALDCEQWVKTFKAAGMKGVILTAKHHDGFCLWRTKTTDYNIANSPYKNGQGDLVRELSDACHRHHLEFGLYLSPWDRHHPEYGREGYQKVYHAQIEELISNYGDLFEFWFDGANGGDGWYGGANEKRSIDPQSYYGYEKAREMILAKHPKAMIFGGSVPDIRWIGNERGVAGETCWSMYDEAAAKHYTESQWGHPFASKWLPGECDVSIRPGWFFHERENHQVKSVANLVDLYYKSVGRNTNLLLNFPISLEGKIHPTDSLHLMQFHSRLKEEFQHNLLEGLASHASAERGRGFSVENLTDGDEQTYWATPDSVNTASLTFLLGKATRLNRLMLQEYIPLGQRVEAFEVEVRTPQGWQQVECGDSLTTIGYKRLLRFKTLEGDALRVNFIKARACLCINNVEAFYAPPLMGEPSIRRDEKCMVSLSHPELGAEIHYTLDGSTPTKNSPLYTQPFSLRKKALVKALAIDPISGQVGEVAQEQFDIAPTSYRVLSPLSKDASRMFDGSAESVYTLPRGEKKVSLSLDKRYRLVGLCYTPDQRRDAKGHISNYEVRVDGRSVARGEFSNIKNHPIRQMVNFKAVEGRKVELVCHRTVEDVDFVSIGEISVLTED